jgi:1-acyl-sn-glycerol-3-phosphate acyltransferase
MTTTLTQASRQLQDAADTLVRPLRDRPVQPPDALVTAVGALRQLGIDWVRRYHRLELTGELQAPGDPVLFVANHGFGGIFDLNVFATLAPFEELALDRPVTMLTHQVAWTLGVGKLLEPFGARPASRGAALEAFEAGHHVLVLPGGDLDAFKSYADRNRIVFGGRTGYARLALDVGVPVVPIVTAGAGDTLLVLSDGQRLARALRLDRLLRLKALPVSLTAPWGLNVGLAGLLPYLPVPANLSTVVLPAISVPPSASTSDLATRVETEMQRALDELSVERRQRTDLPRTQQGD